MAKKVLLQIEFEMNEIQKLFDVYGTFLETLQKSEPDPVELAAAASILHSFYNGVENIFLSIAKRIDLNVPAGDPWHRELLNQMICKNSERENVISGDTAELLSNYLAFRHFFRHSYSHYLNWTELDVLIQDLSGTWLKVKSELQEFLFQQSSKI